MVKGADTLRLGREGLMVSAPLKLHPYGSINVNIYLQYIVNIGQYCANKSPTLANIDPILG